MVAMKNPKPTKQNPSSKKKKSLSQNPFKVKKKSKNSKNPNLIPLGKNPLLPEKTKEKKEKKEKKQKKNKSGDNDENAVVLSTVPAAEQLRFFLDRFQAKYGFKLSPIELEAFKDTSMVELSKSMDQDVDNFSKHIKATFGASWKEVLYEAKLSEGMDVGAPAILVISASALRSLELLRGLRQLTRECRPVKLFAKHMKVEDQAALLKCRVNVACGTPSRIKKLIDIEALSLSRLAVIVLDMQRDAKGYSLFTLPQVSDEFWDLYKSHLNERLLQIDTKICFYGSVTAADFRTVENKKDELLPESDI